MTNLIPLKSIFHIEYGNQFDKNKLSFDANGINFVSRSSKNLGVDSKVSRITDIEPYERGLITITLGGTYLLSSFVQPEPFYTAQNIKVLRPKQEMSFQQKVFYCYAIPHNRFRYTSHGREANKTLDEILVPDIEHLPKWVEKAKVIEINDESAFFDDPIDLDIDKWTEFLLEDLFRITSSGDSLLKDAGGEGKTPYISSTEYNNGVTAFVDIPASNKGNVLTVNRGGSVGKIFYQPRDFLATPVDVRILKPKFELNQYIGLFLSVLIEREKFRFNYSRKMGTARLKNLRIKLPSTSKGHPDWEFMERYIKSLPYSVNL